MFFFDNFIITQRTFYMISGFIILFLGTIINFAISGLMGKNSQKFSNFSTISTLLISSISFLPFLYGFLSPHSSKAFYFFNQNIAFGGLEAFLCFIAQITVLFAFLISKKHLSKLRFRPYIEACMEAFKKFDSNTMKVDSKLVKEGLPLSDLSKYIRTNEPIEFVYMDEIPTDIISGSSTANFTENMLDMISELFR